MGNLARVELGAQPLSRYELLLGPGYELIAAGASAARSSLKDRVVWNVNSTARGGGVAEMLRAYLPYAIDDQVDTRWMVIGQDDPNFFVLTKRIHNNFHNDLGDGGPLGPAEREFYEQSLVENSRALSSMVHPGDVVILHDPQTAGLIPAMKDRGALVIWRCHIGVDEPKEPALRAMELLEPMVRQADACIFSRPSYAWPMLDQARIRILPPGIDAFTPKNQDLDQDLVDRIVTGIGLGSGEDPGPITLESADGNTIRVSRKAELLQESPLPPDVPLVTQVSRWDRLKDHRGLLQIFDQNLENGEAHLALVGPSTAGVDDDPEGSAAFAEIEADWHNLSPDNRRRIHLVSLPMDDLDESAVMVNAIQRRSDVLVQKSLAEGFGLTVSEAMWKAKPVVASRVGGIQDQITDGESGLLIDDPLDYPAFGRAIDALLADPDRAKAMGQAARERVGNGMLSVQRLVAYFELINQFSD